MQFAFPIILAALGALSIPIIIHLFSFRRTKKVVFPTIRFLKQVEEQRASKSKIKHWLILLCRLAAFTALVLAFAKPFFANENASNIDQRNVVSLYIDNSFSMTLDAEQGSLFDEAVRTANMLINQFRESDRFQVLTNSFDGKEQRLLTKQEALERLTELKVKPYLQPLNAVLLRQKEALSQISGNYIRYIISDFQKNVFSPQELERDSIFTTKIIQLIPQKTANLAIDSCWFATPYLMPGQEAQLLVKVSSFAGAERQQLTLNLSQNGQVVALSTINLSANSSSVDTIRFIVKEAGWQKALVTLEDFPITFDDKWYLSYYAASKLPILAISEKGNAPYIEALAKTDAFILFDQMPANQVDVAKLSNYQVIILSELEQLPSGLADELAKAIQQGTTVWLFPNENNPPSNLTEILGLGKFGPIHNQEQSVVQVAVGDLIFKDILTQKLNNPDLPTVKKVFTWQPFSPMRVLMKLADGKPLIQYQQIGNGRVFIATTPLLDSWTNLPRHAFFVPVVFRSWLLAQQNLTAGFVLGNEHLVPIKTNNNLAEGKLRLRLNQQEWIPLFINANNTNKVSMPTDLVEPGWYNLIDQNSDSILQEFGFNYNRFESDLNLWEPKELERAVQSVGFDFAKAKEADSAAFLGAISPEKTLYKWFLLAVLLFLALETLFKKIL